MIVCQIPIEGRIKQKSGEAQNPRWRLSWICYELLAF